VQSELRFQSNINGTWPVAARRFPIIAIGLSFALITAQVSFGQPNRRAKDMEDSDAESATAADETRIDENASSQLGTLNGSLRSVDWKSESKNASQAISKIFERNGWNDEPQRFALDVATKVAAIPPWDLNGRLQVITNAVKERYDLPAAAADQFKSKMFREVFGLVVRNAKAITETTVEAVKSRQDGKPFTNDQVARWCNESADLVKDGSQTAERLVKELEAVTPPDKRDQLHKDWESYEVRQKTIDSMMEKWKKGDWDASQWGMDSDPIQSKKPAVFTDDVPSPYPPTPDEVARKGPVPGRDMKSRITGGAPIIVAGPPESAVKVDDSHWDPNDPSTWGAYVRFVRKKYQFDAAQSSSADSIHTELVERADAYLESHADTMGGVPVAMREKNPDFEPIRQLFGELKDRLDFLPTSGQRETSAR